MSKKLIVAIDGPAGSGKSTSAKLVAQKLGYLYVDSGAMYRAITYLAIIRNVLNNSEEISTLAMQTDLKLKYEDGITFVFANGKNITGEIRSVEVNNNVSIVSKIDGVRKALVSKQKEMGNLGCGIVMEGRDIASVVFPNADVKIFLTASINQRAERRLKEFSEKGIDVNKTDIEENISMRDNLDSTRELSPLVKAKDAFEIDTSNITIDEQVEKILTIVNKIAGNKT
ncbi:MAG: cytidylate kinase [Ignavibacteriales bacterium CG_4_9_14_3_um_filter_30_11]|nr:MAG: cytidylate kinase [Ignavibacteriales bacterium CG_4_9_14_3_um_filter_30_11]